MGRTSRSAILRQLNEPLSVETLSVPSPQEHQILVKVAYCGLCHSQVNEIRGRRGRDPYLPHLLGHEASGTVEEVGAEVTKVKPGDSVVLSWLRGSGAASSPPVFHTQKGERIQAGPVSALGEYAVVSQDRCTRLPEGLPLAEGALLGCAIPTGAGMIFNQLQVQERQSVVILGAGGVGTSALLAAVAAQAMPIIAVDVSETKLEFAKRLGASHTVRFHSEEKVIEAIRPLLPKGADFVIESSGSSQAMESGFCLVREGGGRMVVAGNLPQGSRIQIDPFRLILGCRIEGTVGGSTIPDRDFPRFGDLYRTGKFPLGTLVGPILPLEQVNEGVTMLESGEVVGRILLKMS